MNEHSIVGHAMHSNNNNNNNNTLEQSNPNPKSRFRANGSLNDLGKNI